MSVFSSSHFDQHELVSFREDKNTGLKAIIAVHNTNLGPALGGCRMFPYTNDNEALADVLRLSRGMTYKSALAGLPLGGGKSVIIGNPHKDKTPDLMRAMGDFIESLGGLYITAEDSGTGVEEMKFIAERTSYVSGIEEGGKFGGDPSPYTAHGVFCGIKAAVKHRFGGDSLSGLSVAVQGAGSVGRHLIKQLIEEGAKVLVADVNAVNIQKAIELGATQVSTDEILFQDVDVLAPCAMGAIINDAVIDSIKARIIAGAANNQLATPLQGLQILKKGILYAPDFVINAGGIIDVHYQRLGRQADESHEHVENIANVLGEIFLRSESVNLPTAVVAEQLAEEIFAGKSTPDSSRVPKHVA